jgi:tetratricopeptide (TPR) repeat protein
MHVWYGRALSDLGQYADALAEADAALELDANNADAHLLRGYALNATDQYQEARAALEKAIELDPANAAAYHNLGAVFYEQGDLQTAADYFLQALEIGPPDPKSHYQLGATYLQMALAGPGGEPDEDLIAQASAQFREALVHDPVMPEALIGLGTLYTQTGEYASAIEVLSQARDQDPFSPYAHFALGQAYTGTGDVEAACQAYEVFLTLPAPETWRAEAQRAMGALGCS